MSPDGDLETMFVNDYTMIDQFAATGSLWTWGKNVFGQLGDNSVVFRSSPVQTISGGTNWKYIKAGYSSTAGIKTDGTLWIWGHNSYGKLGDDTRVHKSSPIQTIAGGTNWKQVDITGYYHSTAIKTDGTLWTWGLNTDGQLGDSTMIQKSSPIQTIAGGNNWKQVSGGGSVTAAVKTDGTLWLWGANLNGQLGDNTRVSRSSPVQTISGGTNWKQVSMGEFHNTAIKTDGTLWTWGFNNSGQLGNNTLTGTSSPIQTVAGGTNWKQVSAGGSSTAAIKADGTLWSWGLNGYGQLGDNTRVPKSSPVQTISGGTNWKQVAAAGADTAAIKTDGTLWTWGDNTVGQLGNYSIIHKSSPIQTVAGGTNWKQVTCGYGGIAASYFYDAGNLYPSA